MKTGGIMAIRDHLIDDYRLAHKFISMRMAAVGAGIQTGLMFMPDRILKHVPESFMNASAIICFVGVVLGVLTPQPNLKKSEQGNEAGEEQPSE